MGLDGALGEHKPALFTPARRPGRIGVEVELGLVVALQFLPSLVLGPWFGAVADRHDRRRLLMLAEAGLGLVALTYALVSALDHLTLPWICVLATAWGIVNALDTMSLLAVVLLGGNAAGGPIAAGVAMLAGRHAPFVLGAIAAGAAALIAAHRQPQLRRLPPDRVTTINAASSPGPGR